MSENTENLSLNTCDIADGMLILGHSAGGELPYLVQRSGDLEGTVHGLAYTVEFAPADDPRPAVSGHYIDEVPEGAVLVLATSPQCHLSEAPYTSIIQSLYGGLMSRRAKKLGANGTIVLGQIRDIGEQRSLDYPVFSYGVGACAANKAAKVVSINSPLSAGFGKTVHPGDHIYADANSVVVVPPDLHDKVLEKSQLRAQANIKTAEAIEKGEPCKTAQAYWRKQFS